MSRASNHRSTGGLLSLALSVVVVGCTCGPTPTADTTPPGFAGALGAEALGDTSVRVTWAEGSDDVSAPGALTYLVFRGDSAATVDLSTPVLVTAAGVTSADVTGLPAGAATAFVVRARDEAGNVDANQVVVSATTTFNGRAPARPLGNFTVTGRIHRALTHGNRMYLALGEAGLEVDDITDPPRPIPLATLAVEESAQDAALDAARQLLFVADGTKGVTIVDVRDSANPVKLATFDPGLAPGNAGGAIAVAGETVYLASPSGVFLIDVGTPTAPEVLSLVDLGGPVARLAAEGDRLYAALASGQLRAFDVAAPGPVALGTFAGPADATALVVENGRAFVAGADSVAIVDFTSAAAPAQAGALALAGVTALAVEGTTLAVGLPTAFSSYDVSDASAPELVTSNPVTVAPQAVGISRGLGIYLSRVGVRDGHTSSSEGVILNIPPYATRAVPGPRTGAPANTPVYFEFSKPMDPASLTADSLVVTAGGAAVAGTATFGATATRLTFTPAQPLAATTTYQVALAGTLADTRGDTLYPSSGVTYSFTTSEPLPLPAAPAWLSAIPQDRMNSLSWASVPGALRYHLSWSTTPGVSATSNRVTLWGTSWRHTFLTNGQPYHYAVSVETAAGESPLSAEVVATPVPPPAPQPPAYAWATPGNTRVSLTWSTVSGAQRYNVYWSLTPNAPLSARTKVSPAPRPFTHQGLTNGTPVYYVVTAENGGGESAPSPEVMATPVAPPLPVAVQGLSAVGGNGSVSLSWSWQPHAAWFNVYASTTPGQARLTRVGRAYGTGFTHWGLTNGVPVYYVVTAENDAGEGPDSAELAALPTAPPLPEAPTNVGAVAGDARATVYWSGVPGATRYSVYWSTTPGVTRATGLRAPYGWSPFTHTGLTNGQPYYYVVTASNAAGEGPESAEVAVVPQAPPLPTAPVNLVAMPYEGAVRLSWSPVQGATRYTVYFATTAGVTRSTAARLSSGVYASYWHQGLTNGQPYFYVVTASNSAGESVDSVEVTATPVAPPAPTQAPTLSGTAGNRYAHLWWGGVAGATRYAVYWDTTAGITTASNRADYAWPTWPHYGLVNGTTYYYRVAAVNGGGEGPLSNELSLTPQPPAPPTTPASLTARAGDRRVDLSWSAVSGATRYFLYWATGPGVTTSSNLLVRSYGTSLTHTGLTNGTPYCYAIAAVNDGGQSALSAETCATPTPPPPPTSAPGLAVTAGNGSAALSWTWVSGATSYYVYFKQGAGVTPQNGTRLGVGTSGPFTHWGLSNGTEYCYVATAVNAGGEGPPSAERCVTPQPPPPPGTPQAFAATAGHERVTLTFASVSGATRYVLYWSTSAGVTPQNGTRIEGVWSGYVHQGLTNGTPYYYVLTAENATGPGAPTAQVSATPQAPSVPGVPQNVEAVAGIAQVSLSWSWVQGATGYDVYWSTSAGVTKTTGTKVALGAVTEFQHTGLTNGTTLFYVVAARGDGGESAVSAEVSATPQSVSAPAAPTGVTALAGVSQVQLSWAAVSGATGYRVYWGTASGVTKTSGTLIAVGGATSYTHTGRTNGTALFYVVTALSSAGGESAESAEVSATPNLLAPTWAAVTPGNAQVSLSWNPVPGASGYRLFWAQGTTVTQATGTVVNVSTATSYTHTGRTNGTTYAYVVTALSGTQLSADSVVRTATPVNLTAPTLTANRAYRSVQLNSGFVTGARYYNFYWSTTPGVTPQSGTRLSSTSSGFTHQGLTVGTTYYYVATAVTDAGETPPSTQASATPWLPTPSVSATARDGHTLLSASLSQGSMTGRIYWSTTSPVNKQTASSIAMASNFLSNHQHTGLTNGTTYYYLLEATYPEGTADSTTVSAVPRAAPLTAPNLSSATAGYRAVTLNFNSSQEATGLNVYWSTTSGVTPQTGTKVTLPAGSFSWVHTGLTTGTPYYYVMTAQYPGGESPASVQRTATPGFTAPSFLSLTPGFESVRASFSQVAGATGYNLYWSTTSGVTPQNGTKLSFTTTSYLHTGLTNGTAHYYVLTAQYPDGESLPTAQSAATPAAQRPTSLQAMGSPDAITLTWPKVEGATSYTLYWATGTTVSKTTGTPIAVTGSPLPSTYTHTGRTAGATYAYVVTAVFGTTESADSPVATTMAAPARPAWAQATPQSDTTVNVNWQPVTGITTYHLYWSTQPGVTPSTGTKVVVTGATSYLHTGLTTGTPYFYVVTSAAGTAESAESPVTVGIPSLAAPGTVTVRAGDQSVLVYTEGEASYALYWSTQPSVSKTTGTRVAYSGRTHLLTGLTNGTPVYLVLTRVGSTGAESVESFVYTATPSHGALTMAVSMVETTRPHFTISHRPGAASYNVYFGTAPGVTTTTGTKVTDVYAPGPTANAASFAWDHPGRTAGTTYYYVATAVGPSGESPISNEVAVTPRPGPENLVATLTNPGARELTLSWTATAGATGYRVYCSSSTQSRGSVCGTATGTTYVYTFNEWSDRQYFSVVSLDATGESGPSTVTGFISTSAPDAPVLTVAPGNGFIALTWDLNEFSESNGRRALRWDLYWANTPGVTSSSTRIDDVRATHVHRVANGQPFYYRLVASNPSGESPMSPEVSATAGPSATGTWSNVGTSITVPKTTVRGLAAAVRGTSAFALYGDVDPLGRARVRARRFTSFWDDLGPASLSLDADSSAFRPLLVTDATDVYAAWTEQTGAHRRPEFVVMRHDGTSWARVGAPFNTRSALGHDLRFVGSELHALYSELSADGFANGQVRKWTGSAWAAVGGEVTTAATHQLSAGRLTALGTEPVAVIIEETPQGKVARARHFVGGAWTTFGGALHPATHQASEVAATSSGSTVYVAVASALASGGGSTLAVFSSTGGAFTPLGGALNATPGSATQVSLAMVGTTLHAAFRENGNVVVRVWNGSAWVAVGGGPAKFLAPSFVDGISLVSGGATAHVTFVESVPETQRSAACFLRPVAP